MSELDPTWPRIIAIWWLLMWRTGLGAVLMGFVIGFFIGIMGVIYGVERPVVNLFVSVVTFPIGMVWGAFVIRMAMKKKYRGFRIALVPQQPN
jgi:uncharacterized membrane protein YczE